MPNVPTDCRRHQGATALPNSYSILKLKGYFAGYRGLKIRVSAVRFCPWAPLPLYAPENKIVSAVCPTGKFCGCHPSDKHSDAWKIQASCFSQRELQGQKAGPASGQPEAARAVITACDAKNGLSDPSSRRPILAGRWALLLQIRAARHLDVGAPWLCEPDQTSCVLLLFS